MKKLLLAILPLLLANYVKAQIYTDPNTNYIGIGTTLPAYTCDILGNGFLFQSSTGNHAEILLRDGSIEDPKTTSDNGGLVVNYYGYNGGTSYFRNFTIFNGKGATIAHFNGATSNVGIGTFLPDAKLGIESALAGNFKSLALDNRNTGNGTGTSLYMGFQADSNDPYGVRLLESGTPTATRTGTFAIQRHGATPGDTDWLNSLFIDYTGYVGIGTTRPDQALTVSGTVHATEILVDQNIPQPDYVFKKDYDLATLKEVKTYIDQNHHLPEIPSAAQVAKDGINLGEMNAKLLKKIEELTLYLIQQKEETDQQIKKLKIQIGKLSQQQKTKSN